MTSGSQRDRGEEKKQPEYTWNEKNKQGQEMGRLKVH